MKKAQKGLDIPGCVYYDMEARGKLRAKCDEAGDCSLWR